MTMYQDPLVHPLEVAMLVQQHRALLELVFHQLVNHGQLANRRFQPLLGMAEEGVMDLPPTHTQGLTEEEINLLPTLTFTSQGQEAGDATPGGEQGRVQCQICLLDLEDGNCLRSIPCRHYFHRRCLDEWLKRNATCPSCRQDLRQQHHD